MHSFSDSSRHYPHPRTSFLQAFISASVAVGIIVFLFRYELLSLSGSLLSSYEGELRGIQSPIGRIDLIAKPTKRGKELEVNCIDCSFSSSSLASVPFTSKSLSFTGVVKKNKFEGVARAEKFKLDMSLIWDGESAKGNLHVPATEIAALYQEISSIVPEAEKAKIKGVVQGKGRFEWPNVQILFTPKISNFSVDGLIDKANYSKGIFTYKIRNSKREYIEREAGEGTPDWISLDDIGKLLPAAVLAAEDGAFYSHPGYDVKGIVEASRANREKGKLSRGGSTLTQQLAKNLFLTDERTIARKLRELLYAVEMERELGKKRILEIYLNIVEWGPDIYGAKQASEVYFGKTPEALLPEEAAWLANILRSPTKSWAREYLRKKPNEVRSRIILRRMKGLSEEERDLALSRNFNFRPEK